MSNLKFRKVINTTGTVIHTNLGRSILSSAAISNVEKACGNFVNLEYDLETGKRGHRDVVTEGLIRLLVGCEASTVVNNNAAAVLLGLNTLSKGKEAIASRGELVEIGGSFRLPEVMQNSGAILREVGTTNKTYINDYRNAVNDNTAMLLKAHTSNYKVEGSVYSPDITEIVKLARKFNLVVMEDLGSGAFIDLSKYGLPKEPLVKDSISAGVDVVTFSGDKLLGGPQAGIIAGKKKYIQKIRENPLMRCVRVGKMIISALEATLRIYVENKEMEIPPLRWLARPIQNIESTAIFVSGKIKEIFGEYVDVSIDVCMSQVGSGALPVDTIESRCVAIQSQKVSTNRIAELFRKCETPVIGRISENKFIMDMRTVEEQDFFCIVKAAETVVQKLKK
ncbi:L-seryl-tRNA(Sec) selenium transferase [Candidatus Poribacteria bacterium]|nr:L-seryl-tRNA(Sec) selenium transferase [Candidatus Poribacteria bacterium]